MKVLYFLIVVVLLASCAHNPEVAQPAGGDYSGALIEDSPAVEQPVAPVEEQPVVPAEEQQIDNSITVVPVWEWACESHFSFWERYPENPNGVQEITAEYVSCGIAVYNARIGVCIKDNCTAGSTNEEGQVYLELAQSWELGPVEYKVCLKNDKDQDVMCGIGEFKATDGSAHQPRP